MKHVCVRAEKLDRLAEAVLKLKKTEFPRRKTYQVVGDLRSAPGEAALNTAAALKQIGREGTVVYDELVDACGHVDAAWYHLAELWDYVRETEARDATV